MSEPLLHSWTSFKWRAIRPSRRSDCSCRERRASRHSAHTSRIFLLESEPPTTDKSPSSISSTPPTELESGAIVLDGAIHVQGGRRYKAQGLLLVPGLLRWQRSAQAAAPGQGWACQYVQRSGHGRYVLPRTAGDGKVHDWQNGITRRAGFAIYQRQRSRLERLRASPSPTQEDK